MSQPLKYFTAGGTISLALYAILYFTEDFGPRWLDSLLLVLQSPGFVTILPFKSDNVNLRFETLIIIVVNALFYAGLVWFIAWTLHSNSKSE